ncbi:MAG TPA: ABC transporter ATP-binding protein [Acidimicrobiales bacterium]|jgi:ABC-2 type transport system ATP-binding protein|nr:ABC transporter ATP-binding protein [Acidimicrobiales bacterium]
MPALHAPAVKVTGLTVRYGSDQGVTAVDGLDLDAHAGEVLVVLGPNGAGKTSTIEALEGYRRPASGRVEVLGLDPIGDHHRLTGRMGVMLQNGGVYPMLGPRQVLTLFAHYYPNPLETESLLDLVGLRSVAATPWRHLSGGEQQRLSLALALIGRPDVAFLDEPTAGVDPEGRLAIRAVVADLRAQGACVLLTTHELGEAEKMADRIVILSAGRVVREGTLEELLASTSDHHGLTFGAPPGLDTASLAAALGAGVRVAETGPGRYRIEGASGPAATAALATWLAERAATLTDLATGHSLEDVYFAAVGAAAADQPEAAAVPGGRGRGRERRGGRPSGRRPR